MIFRFNRFGSITVACVLGFALGSSTASANLIDLTHGVGAGSFELGPYPGGTFSTVVPGGTDIAGWTVGGPGDGVNWLLDPAFRADTGRLSVDLKNLTNSSISTVIPTEVGATYEVSFAAASVAGYDNAGLVSAGSLVNQAFFADFSSSFTTQSYKSFAFQFTATGATTTLRFEATGDNSPPDGRYGPAIDSVSVVALSSVPEPNGMILLGSGSAIVSLAHLGFRRRSKE
jgi:hypothetical protein